MEAGASRRAGMRGAGLAPTSDERGFSLMEVVVATVIAIIAVMGLAHSFGAGRALIRDYEAARSAMTVVQGELERLTVLAMPGNDPNHADLAAGAHGPFPTVLSGGRPAQRSWDIVWVNDPATASGPNDYTRAIVRVVWTEGTRTDSVVVSRTLPTS